MKTSPCLTEREWEVLRLLAEGKQNKEIAHLLVVAEHTVEHHLSHIYQKLGVAGRVEAARWYWMSRETHEK